MFFISLAIIELFGLYLLYSLIHKFIISKWNKKQKQNNIQKNTNILITGAAIGYVILIFYRILKFLHIFINISIIILKGRTLTLEFAEKHKCTIILWEIRSYQCKQLIKEIEKLGGEGYFFECDVSKEH